MRVTSFVACCGGDVEGALGHPLGPPTLMMDHYWPAAATAQHNNLSSMVWMRDIARQATLEDAVKFFGRDGADVVQSYAPCTEFSSANSMNAEERRASACNDLFVRALDYVERLRPRVYMLENVPGLLAKTPDGRYRTHHYPMALERLRSMGFRWTQWILDAADYGTPQHRRRVFLVAVRRGMRLPRRPEPTHGPGRARPWRGWDDVMVGLSEAESRASGVKPISPAWEWILRGIPPGWNWRWLLEPCARCPGNDERLAYIMERYDGDPTMRAAARPVQGAPSGSLVTSPTIQQMLLHVGQVQHLRIENNHLARRPTLSDTCATLTARPDRRMYAGLAPTRLGGGMTGLARRPRTTSRFPTMLATPTGRLTCASVTGTEPRGTMARRSGAGKPYHTLSTSPDHVGTNAAYTTSAPWVMDRPSGDIYIMDDERGDYVPIPTRAASVEEYRRLFGVPQGWEFPYGTKRDDKYLILGNGVAPAVGCVVEEAIAEVL